MGNTTSRAQLIETNLMKVEGRVKSAVNIYVLGGPCSGKSTLLLHLRRLQGAEPLSFSEEQLEDCRAGMVAAMFDGLRSLLQAVLRSGAALAPASAADVAAVLGACRAQPPVLTAALAAAIDRLWQREAMLSRAFDERQPFAAELDNLAVLVKRAPLLARAPDGAQPLTPGFADFLLLYTPTCGPARVDVTLRQEDGDGGGGGCCGGCGDGRKKTAAEAEFSISAPRAAAFAHNRRGVAVELPGAATQGALELIAPLLAANASALVHCVALTDFCRLLPGDIAGGLPPRNALTAALDEWEALLSARAANGRKAFAAGDAEWGTRRGAAADGASAAADGGAAAAGKQRLCVHLLLTKLDLFEDLLRRGVPLRFEGSSEEPARFLDFRGGLDATSALAYVKGRFERLAEKHRVAARVDTANLLEKKGAVIAKVRLIVEEAFAAKQCALDAEQTAEKAGGGNPAAGLG